MLAITIVICILAAVACFVVGFAAGFLYSPRDLSGKAKHSDEPIMVSTIEVDEDGRFTLCGQVYEFEEDALGEDYEVVEMPEFDSFGIPLTDKKDNKPN